MEKATETLIKYIEKGDSKKPNDYYGFLSFKLFLNPIDTKILINAFTKEIRKIINEVDYLVPLVNSGSPLIGWLQYKFEKPVFFLSLKKNCKGDEKINQHIPKDAKICLVDTNINRTTTFWLAANELATTGNHIDRMAVLFFNDLWGKKDERLIKLNETNKILYLNSTSSLKLKKYID